MAYVSELKLVYMLIFPPKAMPIVFISPAGYFIFMLVNSKNYNIVSFCRYLLREQNRLRSVNDIMPMVGARFYTQLDASQLRNDILENEVAKVLAWFFEKSSLQIFYIFFFIL